MFDPNITKGPLYISNEEEINVIVSEDQKVKAVVTTDDDALAFIALSELLEVYKSAKNLVTSNKGVHKPLERAIKQLEERYCDSCCDEDK